MKIIVRLQPSPRNMTSSAICSTSLSAKFDASVSVMSRMPADNTCCLLAPLPATDSAAARAPISCMRIVLVVPRSSPSVRASPSRPPVHTRTTFSAGLLEIGRLTVVERSASSFSPCLMISISSFGSSFRAAP